MNTKSKSKAPESQNEKPGFEKWLESFFASAFLSKYGKITLYGILIGAVLVSFAFFQLKKNDSKTVFEHKLLGPAYVYFSHNKMDSVEYFLKDFVTGSHPPIVKAKAYLLMGKAQFLQAKYDLAIASYQQVKADEKKHSLIASGALHGMAACYIQQKDFQNAIQQLERFLDTYMKQTGDMKDRSLQKEPEDLSPSVPNALWKLTLCYWQLNDKENTKVTSEKLIKIYSESEEAQKAKRLLSIL
ncbi:MAG: tetratricopeptide repeat protein [Fibrobacteria bacterium]|nr:tetratricopeptide repeat protein [Fibrobacteria bacterium]